ncbi:hypothetical protein C5B98_08430 [Rathayibacter sp. AY1A5]|nr:hypothetical protein C5B98_08430 [Rathayibacter sp. AY1A5]
MPAFYADRVDVTDAWGRLVDALRVEAPITLAALRPGARPEEIAVAEQRTGVSWPDSYREWFACVNGSTQTPETWGEAGFLLPGFTLFSLDDVVSQHAMFLDSWERPDDADAASFYATPPIEAGMVANTFLPSFLPFAGLDGYLLFCDARPGAAHGCIAEFAAENADTGGTLYPNLASLLDALTAAVVGRTHFLHFSPVVTAGRLEWPLDDDEVLPAVDADLLPPPSTVPLVEESPRPRDDGDGYLVVTLGVPSEATGRTGEELRP